MSLEIVKETGTWWRVNACGNSMTFETKAEAKDYMKKMIDNAQINMAVVQSRLDSAKKSCMHTQEKYNSLIHNIDMIKVDIVEFSADSCYARWETFKSGTSYKRYTFHFDMPADLYRSFPSDFFKEYLRYRLRYYLKQQLRFLKEEKKRYYDAVRLAKEAKEFKFEEED